MSGYTSYGSEGRYSGKFRVMQQRGLSSLLSLFLSRIVSFSLASFLRLSFSSPFLSLCFGSVRQGCSFRFVSFFVSKDKPMVRSRRSRRPTAYTRTRQLLRTTRHIVSDSPPLFTTVPLSLSLSLCLSIFEARRDAIRTRGGGFRAATNYVYRKAPFREYSCTYASQE